MSGTIAALSEYPAIYLNPARTRSTITNKPATKDVITYPYCGPDWVSHAFKGVCYLLILSDSVTELLPQDTADTPFWYTFKVQCTSCRETHPNFVSVSRFVRKMKE
jgi:hypothetical protein